MWAVEKLSPKMLCSKADADVSVSTSLKRKAGADTEFSPLFAFSESSRGILTQWFRGKELFLLLTSTWTSGLTAEWMRNWKRWHNSHLKFLSKPFVRTAMPWHTALWLICGLGKFSTCRECFTKWNFSQGALLELMYFPLIPVLQAAVTVCSAICFLEEV